MNKRIKELIKKAGGIQHDEDGDELTPILIGKDLEKFAELIIKECINTVVNTEIEGNNNAMLRGEIATRLTKHFGVE